MRSNWFMLSLVVAAGFGCGSDSSPAVDAGITGGDFTSTGGNTMTGGDTMTGGILPMSGGGTTITGGNPMTGGDMVTGGDMMTDAAMPDAMTDAMTDSMMPTPDSGTPLPTDGTQGALCVGASDCGQGLDCFDGNAAGQGICTATCSMDSDCDGITDGTYVCGTSGSSNGLCVVECTGTDDTSSCPSPQTCQQNGFGMTATYHCQNPPPPPAGLWEQCSGISGPSCDTDLSCIITSSMGFSAFCTESCSADGDCSTPSTGDATVECRTIGGGGGGSSFCDLNCGGGETCPDGMDCTGTGYCRIPN